MKARPLELADQTPEAAGAEGRIQSSEGHHGHSALTQAAQYLATERVADDIRARVVEMSRAMPGVAWAEFVTADCEDNLTCGLQDKCGCRSLQTKAIREAVEQARQTKLFQRVGLPEAPEAVLVFPMTATGESTDLLVLGLLRGVTPDEKVLSHYTAFAGLAGQALCIWSKDQRLLQEHRDLEADMALQREELEHQQEFDRILLENLATGVAACDANGRLVLFNHALREWHGIGPTGAPMQEWASSFRLYEADGTIPLAEDRIPLVRAFRGEQVRRFAFVIKSQDGHERLVVASGGPLRAPDGCLLGAVIAIEDTTEETRTRRELREANVRLRDLLQRTEETARKAELANEAKSEFLATMSHELRTPMSGVLGMADVLSTTSLDEEQRGCLDLIRSSGESLLSLINGVLDFSKIEAGQLNLEFHDFEFTAFLHRLADTYAATAAAKGLWLRLECGEGLPHWLHADSCRLQQVLANLLNNAVKFTDEGGITLSVIRTSETPEWASLQFAVRDTGSGIPPEKRDLLFKRFSQLDSSTTRKHEGTGLGLAICKQLVELFGGSIGVISPPPGRKEGTDKARGSEFWFTVRLAKGRGGAAPPQDGAADHPFTRRHRVLVVEDNPVNRRMLVSMLQKFGLEAEWAGNGQEALDRLNRAQFDLILMDLQMPVMGGEQTARRIRALPEKHPARAVPIIAVSAHAFPEDKLRCIQAGMNDHVTKPIQIQKLQEALRRWLERTAATTT